MAVVAVWAGIVSRKFPEIGNSTGNSSLPDLLNAYCLPYPSFLRAFLPEPAVNEPDYQRNIRESSWRKGRVFGGGSQLPVTT